MFWQRVRLALLLGVVTAGGVSARAEEGAAAPAYRTVCVTEMVPQQVQCTRTVYRTQCTEEPCTAYRCECVPETRTRECTVYKMVQEARTETRTVCVCVPCVEERTVMRSCVTCKPVTRKVRRVVDRGHWECRVVPCESHSLRSRLHGLLHRRRDCCDSCCEPCCVPMKTVRVWVPCKVCEEVCVTCMERVCECKPVTCKVTTYKKELRTEQVQVTCCKCVPEKKIETCTVMVRKTVPYQTTRKVVKCVPVQETYTVCKMVPRVVQKQVAVEPCCAKVACCKVSCCPEACCRPARRCRDGLQLGNLLHRRHHDCCH